MDELSGLFASFVRPHWRRLHLVARRYAAGEEDARDLVQETLMRAWRGFSPTEERTYRLAWLFVIMRNIATEWHRAASRRVRLVSSCDNELTDLAPIDLQERLAPLPNLEERQFREFLRAQLSTALDKLDDPFREVVLLSVAGGLSYRQIAEVLDCPVGTVMSRMARARRALREGLADFARQEGLMRSERS